ncbi:unnamed protein product [Diatraea saccharalis]|uniref:LRRCT domain-containing protein n=1 Tax=Diatraea saccharalis TaxID=40085 RepID=A0A9N9WAV2_9NEOP|nr:unnamed protein product [Diatraea saccharalis]
MRATCFGLLFLILYSVRGQDVNNETNLGENYKLLKLSEVCTCSEIPDVDGTHLVLNILCSELDRIENVADLDKIEWPPNPNGLKISAAFEGLGLTTIGKLPPNSQVESLRFSNNAIKTYWPDPFSDVPNLTKLSFAQNDLRTITPDLFTKIDRLEDLDLSYNKITDFNPLDFKHLRMVKRLNLQSNQLSKIPLEALLPMTALEDLDLSKNGIYDLLLQRTDGVGLSGLKRFYLNSNRIRSVTKHSFPIDNKLELLDLSNNLIEIIDEDAFYSCANLKELNLGQNNITLVFQLPPALQIAIFKINTFYHWPTFPGGIKYIDLSYNRLSALYDETNVNFETLEILKVGGNQIKNLDIQKSLPNLFILDISYNLFNEIPKTLSEQYFPNLEELRLDGNPIKSIYFNNVIVLKRLHMNDLDKLVKVDDKAFSNVVGRNEDEIEEESRCFYLYLSNCHSLNEIHVGAFEGTAVCMLDLSKNNLTNLPRDLLRWSSVREGVNLQHNPWRCTCHLQWMIDHLLPLLYNTNSSYLLDDLRCGSPRAYEHLRLVHWYNWTDRAMCSDGYLRAGPHDTYILEASTEGNPFNVSTMTLILSVCILVSVLVAVALTIYLIATRKRYRIRRAALKRKRQSAIDAKHTNGTEKEKFGAFNKT